MSRAEDAAMKAYPPFICNEGQVDEEDLNLNNRECFVEGYRSAETDLALTWEDIADIVILADTVIDGHEEEWKKLGPEAYYSAVLRAYKNAKD